MKANFNSLYSRTTPKAYIENIVRDLDYCLPTTTMARYKREYLQSTSTGQQTRLTVLGSSYGLEVVVLKNDFSHTEMIDYWLDADNMYKTFPATPQYQINFVDLELNALKYAKQVKLCDRYLVASLSQEYSEELETLIGLETDVIMGIGVATYIGQEGFERLIKCALINGNASTVLYSLPNFQRTYPIKELCESYGLSISQLGPCIAQRQYASPEEKDAMRNKIIENNIPLQEIDEHSISTNLYVISS